MNKFRLYIRQAFAMMKDEKIFSGIYITGTALALTFTMIMAVSYYIMIADTENEPNRSQTYEIHQTIQTVIDGEYEIWGGGNPSVGMLPVREWIYPLNSIKLVTAYSNTHSALRPSLSKKETLEVWDRETDGNYFKMYHHKFLEGRPYTQEDMLKGNKVCVISRDFADKYFGKDVKCVGKFIRFHDNPKVVGVIEPVSPFNTNAFSHVFYPISNFQERDNLEGRVALIPKDNHSDKEISNQIRQKAKVFASKHKETRIHVCDEFDETHLRSHTESVIYDSHNPIVNIGGANENFLFTFLILLIIPALNLSGLISSRMNRRLPEMGVRKAFGAKKSELLNQVITENLVLTTIGGIIGLILCWILIIMLRGKIFYLLGLTYIYDYAPMLPGEMLFSPALFAITFGFCIIINLMAGVIPAWLSLRKPIVESLNHKK